MPAEWRYEPNKDCWRLEEGKWRAVVPAPYSESGRRSWFVIGWNCYEHGSAPDLASAQRIVRSVIRRWVAEHVACWWWKRRGGRIKAAVVGSIKVDGVELLQAASDRLRDRTERLVAELTPKERDVLALRFAKESPDAP